MILFQVLGFYAVDQYVSSRILNVTALVMLDDLTTHSMTEGGGINPR